MKYKIDPSFTDCIIYRRKSIFHKWEKVTVIYNDLSKKQYELGDGPRLAARAVETLREIKAIDAQLRKMK